jgi:hypothetical protein
MLDIKTARIGYMSHIQTDNSEKRRKNKNNKNKNKKKKIYLNDGVNKNTGINLDMFRFFRRLKRTKWSHLIMIEKQFYVAHLRKNGI